MSRRAVVRISTEMLGQLLGLPEDLEILHITVGNYGLAFDLVVTAPDMADTDTVIGAIPPLLHPVYQVTAGVVRMIDVDYPRAQSVNEPGSGPTVAKAVL